MGGARVKINLWERIRGARAYYILYTYMLCAFNNTISRAVLQDVRSCFVRCTAVRKSRVTVEKKRRNNERVPRVSRLRRI